MLRVKGGNCSAYAFPTNIPVRTTGQKEKTADARKILNARVNRSDGRKSVSYFEIESKKVLLAIIFSGNIS